MCNSSVLDTANCEWGARSQNKTGWDRLLSCLWNEYFQIWGKSGMDVLYCWPLTPADCYWIWIWVLFSAKIVEVTTVPEKKLSTLLRILRKTRKTDQEKWNNYSVPQCLDDATNQETLEDHTPGNIWDARSWTGMVSIEELSDEISLKQLFWINYELEENRNISVL